MSPSVTQRAAGALARSFLFRRGKRLFELNSKNWDLQLSKWDKLCAGGWVILSDYAAGVFPPKFSDRQATHLAEKAYRFSIPGVEAAEVARREMTKPFSPGRGCHHSLKDFMQLAACLEDVGLRPPAKLLELGCGGGWTAEFLAMTGFNVVATTISEDDVVDASRRIRSIEAKGLVPSLKFLASPMESVHKTVEPGSFDGVIVYEALHHAFDWQQALASASACVRDGGWFLICGEPNVLHTFISYRVAKLSNTHEIGFSRRELMTELRNAGFRKMISAGPKCHCWFRPHWLLAQK
jgi:2-polyprenyl-3-methyl-5-hydroxy-6-metoxy-1,4-benzoquinol methylase